VVPAAGLGIAPGVQSQPAWHICPIWQIRPGMHTACRDGRDAEVVGRGGVVGAVAHPLSSMASGHAPTR